MSMELPNLTVRRDSLVARFADFGQRVRLRLIMEGLARVVALAVGLGLLSFILDRYLRLAPITRIGLLILGLIVLAIETWRHVISAIRLKLDPVDLAFAIDHQHGTRGIASRVATILELPALANAGTSSVMIEQAIIRSHDVLDTIDLGSHLDDRRRKLSVSAIAALVVFSFIMLSIRPSLTDLWARRLFLASTDPWPQRTYLDVIGFDGNPIIVPRGEPFALRVSARNGSETPQTIEVRYRVEGGSKNAANLTKFGPNDFRYDFPAVSADTQVELRGGDDVLGPITIHPVDRPRITDLQLLAQHPTEAKPQTYHFSGEDADISFLPKTKMHLEFAANTAISDAHVKSATTQPIPATPTRLDDHRFALDWTQEAPVQLEIELTSTEAKLTSVPTAVSIGLKQDKPPRATLAFTGVHPRITPQATIPLSADAHDDYGIAAVTLNIQTDRVDPSDPKKFNRDTSTTNLFGPANPATELEVQQNESFAVSPLKLAPGNLLSLSATATDACYTGPQKGESRQITFRIVSPEDLFREILLRQQSERVKFRRQTDEARKLRDSLATLATPDALAQASRQFRANQREVARITTSLAETLTEIKLNALGTPEAQELMEKNVINPLKTMNTELLNPQKDALDALTLSDSTAISAAQSRQDQIVARMEQILKQMNQWDSFVDVLNQLNEIIKLQGDVKKDTEQLKSTQTEGVFDR